MNVYQGKDLFLCSSPTRLYASLIKPESQSAFNILVTFITLLSAAALSKCLF